MKFSARDIARLALLIALALAVSYFESFIPVSLIPLPGIKLGLANVVTLFALYALGAPSAVVVLLLKCVLSFVFGGNITSFCFSLCGGLVAFFAMAAAKKFSFFSVYGVSVIGAAFHGAGQIAAACVMLTSASAVYYLPVLLITSVFTGILTAFIASLVISKIGKV